MTVPVYYDPQNPENALLERDPPLPIVWLHAIAAGVFLVGLAVLAVFWNISTIFDGMAGYFPEKAFLPGIAFFTFSDVLVFINIWDFRLLDSVAYGILNVTCRIITC